METQQNYDSDINSDGKSTFQSNGLSDDQREVLDSVPIPHSVDIKIEDAKSIPVEAIEMNNAFELSKSLYQNVLSPQLEENEDLKRKHKKLLMEELFKILKCQFIFTYIFVIILLIGALFSNFLKINENIVLGIISFVKFYITSIIVELLSILFFIVKNVFDKSIVDLIKNFDKRNSK